MGAIERTMHSAMLVLCHVHAHISTCSGAKDAPLSVHGHDGT